jgi:hypothetical protein
MLDCGDDVVGLNPANMFARQCASQQRIFTQIFEISTTPRVAGQVDPARQQDVEGLARASAPIIAPPA